MDLPAALSRIVVPKGDTNHARFPRARGAHYEVWYLTFNSRPDRLGFWLRYTVDVPLAGPAFGELWAHAFDAALPARSFGLRQRFPASALFPAPGPASEPSSSPPGALVRVGEAALFEGRAHGAIRQGGHAIAWDLRFSPDPCAVHLAPFPLRALGLAKTSVVFANPDARFFGAVTVDGRAVPIDGEPGSQTHLWGSKHAERWAWGHCNAFDGRDDCAIDGVAAFLGRRGEGRRGPLTGVYVRYRGEDYCLNALPRMLLAQSKARFPSWRFRGCARGLAFEGTFRCAPERMVQVTYEDPDGERSYCANSEIADLILEVRRGGRLLDRLVALGTAHLELGAREPAREVRATV